MYNTILAWYYVYANPFLLSKHHLIGAKSLG